MRATFRWAVLARVYLSSVVTAPGWGCTVLSTPSASTCSYSVPGDIARYVILSRQPCPSASSTQLWHCLSIRKALSGASVRMELPQLRIQCVVLFCRLRQICYHHHSQQTSVPPGLRRNTSMPLTTSPPHPHRHMGEPRIPKHPATQTHHPPRSIHSTTRRHQGRQPCTTQTSSPPTLPLLLRGPTSPAPVPRATTRWHQAQQAIRTPIPRPATTPHLHQWPIRPVPAPALLATVR